MAGSFLRRMRSRVFAGGARGSSGASTLCTSTQPSVGLWGNQNLRRVRAESSRRPPRHRCDACSMAWRCRFLTAISQDALVDFHTAVGESTEHSSNASSSSSSMGTAQLPRLSRSHESSFCSIASSVVTAARAWRRARGGATKAFVVSNVVATAVSQRILVAVCCAPALGLASSWDFQK